MPHSGRTLPVSSELQWLLGHWQSDGRLPVAETPRPASAIVLLRDSLDGLQVYITRQFDARGVTDRNRWAFPMGNLRPGDLRKLPVAGWNSARCARALKIENSSRALQYFSAVARVTFAVTGVLLAENVDRELIDTPQLDLRTVRSKLFTRDVTWSQFLRERDLRLRPDLCRPWMRWINTAMQLRRFDTTYFVATVPFGQDIDFLSPTEAWGGWMRPQDILADAGEDPDRIGASTRLIVESLIAVPTVGAAMTQVRDVHPLRPEVIDEDGEWRVLIQPGRDPYRKGTMRDFDVAEGEQDDEVGPGFVSLGDDDIDDDDSDDEENEDR